MFYYERFPKTSLKKILFLLVCTWLLQEGIFFLIFNIPALPGSGEFFTLSILSTEIKLCLPPAPRTDRAEKTRPQFHLLPSAGTTDVCKSLGGRGNKKDAMAEILTPFQR